MKRATLPEHSAGAQPYSAQATAPSEQDKRHTQQQPLRISWWGPESQCFDFTLGSGTRIGREPTNDLVLSGNEVSRRHAEILEVSGGFVLNDLGSRNGVFVNGQRIGRVELDEGQVLRFGDWIGVVLRGVGGALRELAPGMWGGTRLEQALRQLRLAASSPLNLIISGETGTGKELVAKAIFEWSGLAGRFVPVNCAALAEALFEAELFGHARGAFTGAVGERLGHLREADGGLLFLDEIGELGLSQQGKLLRVMEEQEVTPLGTSQRLAVRLRVLAATHRDLRQMVKLGTFRADLLARLEGLELRLPPLRERRADVVPLFVDFARARLGGKAPRLSPELAQALALYDWPGNARELKQLAARSAVLHSQLPKWGLNEVDLPVSASASPQTAPLAQPSGSRRKPPERQALLDALTTSRGVVAQAARQLGVSKQTLYRLLDEHSIDLSAFRAPSRDSA